MAKILIIISVNQIFALRIDMVNIKHALNKQFMFTTAESVCVPHKIVYNTKVERLTTIFIYNKNRHKL